ncbi:MAG: c-type cytochrome [Gemmatimonadaceae bacterium]
MHVVVRRAGFAAGAIVGLLAVAGCVVYVASQRHIARRYQVPVEALTIPTDSASIARGRHLARAIAKCADCHGPDLSGGVFNDNVPMGHWDSQNLTRGKGGVGATFTPADWMRAIRHGVARDGHPLTIMPAIGLRNLSTSDIGAIVAYALSLPPVDKVHAAPTFGPVARMLIAQNKLPVFSAELIDHTQPPRTEAPPVGPTAEYGHYIMETGGCYACHGPTLAGGHIDVGPPDWPMAANLTPTGLKNYDLASFTKALRTGVRPDGSKLNEVMPFAWTKEMTDDEIAGVWKFLQTIPPRAFGAR